MAMVHWSIKNIEEPYKHHTLRKMIIRERVSNAKATHDEYVICFFIWLGHFKPFPHN